MTQNEIIEMARQAGLRQHIPFWSDSEVSDALQAFAKLVAERERNACAKVCGKFADQALVCGDEDAVICFEQAEDAIRARSLSRGEA